MSFIADAHRQWHMIHGQNTVCPLDCGVGEVNDYDPEEDEQEAPSETWGAFQGSF